MEKMSVAEFVDAVRVGRPEYPVDFVTDMADSVLSGRYNRAAPAAGAYRIERRDDRVVATILPLHPEAVARHGLAVPNEGVVVELVA